MSFELIKNDYDTIYWRKPEVISYHIIYHLCKYIGFDFLTFTPLDDDLFDPQAPQTFFRFHYLALPFRKMSSHVIGILLTNKSLEPKYKSVFESMDPRVAESFFNGIKESITALLLLEDDNGKPTKVNKDRLVDALEIYFGSMVSEPMFHWENQDDLEGSIEVFNQRKQYLRSNGYKFFLEKCFNNAYANHFKQIKGVPLNNALATKEEVNFLNEIYKGTKLKFKHKK